MKLSTRETVLSPSGRSVYTQAVQLIRNENRFDFVAGMTLLLLLLKLQSIWFVDLGIVALCCLALLHRGLSRNENFWFGLLVFLIVGVYNYWYALDNHQYLFVIWCLAIGCSRMAPHPDEALQMSARLLIGLCFAFATIWKLITPEYTDGTFFNHLLLADKRFEDIAIVIGGIPEEVLRSNREALSTWIRYGDPRSYIQLAGNPVIPKIAHVLTWWTIGIEGCIAIVFLSNPSSRLSRYKDVFLLVFLFSTYLLAPVIGFAWVLATMGLAQTPLGKKKLIPVMYITAFLFLESASHFPLGEVIQYVYSFSI